VWELHLKLWYLIPEDVRDKTRDSLMLHKRQSSLGGTLPSAGSLVTMARTLFQAGMI